MPPSEKKTTRPHPWIKLHPPANAVMQVHTVSGNMVVLPSLMCASRTPSLVPIGTMTTRKDMRSRRRRRRTNISVHAWKFIPLVYSVDGIAGREAKNVETCLAHHLSEKWHKQLPEIVHYVRNQMAIAVVCANSLLISGSRDRQRSRHIVISDRQAMNGWHTWSEQWEPHWPL